MRIGERGVYGALPLSSSTRSSAQLESAFQKQEGQKVGKQRMCVWLLAAGWLWYLPSFLNEVERSQRAGIFSEGRCGMVFQEIGNQAN